MRFFMVLLLIMLAYGCQPIIMRGKVIDEHRKPLSGVRILVKRSAQSSWQTVTDEKGDFYLGRLQLADSILIVLQGYKPVSEIMDIGLIRHPKLSVIMEYADEIHR